MFGKFFGKNNNKAGAAEPRQKPPLPTTFHEFKEMAHHHAEALTAAHQSSWGLGSGERWDVDLAKGEITWIFPDKVVRAPAQLIATWNSADTTFLWGWDHPSAPPGTAIAAAAVKAHADTSGIVELLDPKPSCSMEEGWALAAMAVLAGDLQGVYRGQASDTAWAYIGFGNVTISKA